MKVSLNWVKRIDETYGCAANPAPKGIDDLVEKIGRQLGGVDEVIYLGKNYQGILIAKVIKVEKHPDADKLQVCLIDDGKADKKVKRDKDGLVQVVCGAPNVAEGQLVAWIPPGATVPSTIDKEPFVLEAKEIRGVFSNGMLASAKELGISDDHSGILEVELPAKPGQSFAEVYQLDDYIIDIENKMFTHRPDLFGLLGIARELAGIQQMVFKSPAWYREDASIPKHRGDGLKLSIKNEAPKQVPRFVTVAIRDIKVQPSPFWLQTYLNRVGIRPINNIVDLTNFYMYVTAQPLHAYDYDKVGDQLIVRPAKVGEPLNLLNGKTIKLLEGDIVIASKNQAIGLAGVMGGSDTEVDENTKNIILECANFNLNTVRKSAMAHGLFTDAATRFTKNQSPRQIKAVLAKLVEDILNPEFSGGRIASPVTDIKQFRVTSSEVRVNTDFINSRLGLDLSVDQISKLLANVEFKITSRHPRPDRGSSKKMDSRWSLPSTTIGGGNDNLVIEVPFWRTDIEIPEDIVEEVGRLYGYDHLRLQLPKRNLEPAQRSNEFDFHDQLRQLLSAAGANEVQTYSFVNEHLLEVSGQDKAKAYKIRNALSPNLQYYRLTIAPSLLEKIHPNIKAGYDNFCLFEIGRSHVKDVLDSSKLPAEMSMLATVLAIKTKHAGHYEAQHLVNHVLYELGIEDRHYEPLTDKQYRPGLMDYYDPARTAVIMCDGEIIGLVGEPTAAVKQSFKLPSYVSLFELDLDKLINLVKFKIYQPLNRFPAVIQDICLRLPSQTTFETADNFIFSQLKKLSKPTGYHGSVDIIDIFQRPNDKAHKQITWRISIVHPDRTLTTEEVNGLLDKLAESAKQKLKADRI